MRILSDDKDEAIKSVMLLLTIDEAKELKGSLDELLVSNLKNDHIHIDDEDYKHEITVALYEPAGQISQFHERVQRLILEDK